MKVWGDVEGIEPDTRGLSDQEENSYVDFPQSYPVFIEDDKEHNALKVRIHT